MLKTIKEIKDGTAGEIVVLARSTSMAVDKNGKKYQKIRVKDSNGNESIFVDLDMTVNKFPSIMKFKIKSSGGGIRVLGFEEYKNVSPRVFLNKPRLSPKACWDRYKKISDGLRSPLKEIVEAVIEKEKPAWQTTPLDESGAYCRFAGLMEASIKLSHTAASMASTYGLDKDLISAGALLCYIGNTNILDEMYTRTLKANMTDASVTAYTMIENAISDVKDGIMGSVSKDIFEQDIMLLENIVLSANGSTDPLTPEAVCLKQLSSLNIEVDNLLTATNGMPEGSIVTLNKTSEKKTYVAKKVKENNSEVQTTKEKVGSAKAV